MVGFRSSAFSDPLLNFVAEVLWTWERESPRRKPRSPKKCLEKPWPRGPKGPKIISEKARQVSKAPFSEIQTPLHLTCRTLFFKTLCFRTFLDILKGFAGRLFETFWLQAPRLPLPGPRNLNESVGASTTHLGVRGLDAIGYRQTPTA